MTASCSPTPVRPIGSAPLRIAIVLVSIALAYHYSLASLLSSLAFDTPLAYLALAPVVALAVAAARGRPERGELAVHDRQVDYIVGLPLLVAAVAIVVVEPAHLSTLFWEWRIDLLSLPLFAAGAVAVAFGVRAMWRLRVSLALLLLAWPLPYVAFLTRILDVLSIMTIGAVRLAVEVAPVAVPVGGGDGSLFSVGPSTEPFTVSIGSACAGASGVLGFVIVGLAVLAVSSGRRGSKLLWLSTGMTLAWVLNVVRLLLIFAAARWWGESFAIEALHPVAGLVLFDVAGLGMFLLLRRFGLRISLPPAARDRRPAVEHGGAAIVVVVTVATLLAVVNAGFRDFDATTTALGSPRLVAFSDRPARPAGWAVRRTDSYTWARRYFGVDSSWLRFAYSTQHVPGAVPAPQVVADVISTASLRSLSAYGLEACYRFHGYRLHDVHSVDVGGGIAATLLTYTNPKAHAQWTVLYWRWRVRSAETSRYERVVLMTASDARVPAVADPDRAGGRALSFAVDNVLRSPSTRTEASDAARFLTSFARSLVATQPRAEVTP